MLAHVVYAVPGSVSLKPEIPMNSTPPECEKCNLEPVSNEREGVSQPVLTSEIEAGWGESD